MDKDKNIKDELVDKRGEVSKKLASENINHRNTKDDILERCKRT